MAVEMGAVMRTQEEIFNAKGERIFTQDELRQRAAASPLDSKNVVIAVLIGLVAGYLASFVISGSGGLFQYLVSGVMGSFVGSAVLQKLGFSLGIRSEVGRDIATATIGAIIVMIVAKMLT
jgi:uncharacterized membrane protein YeaQ/YmgE (transglycosylase-associated protein family)